MFVNLRFKPALATVYDEIINSILLNRKKLFVELLVRSGSRQRLLGDYYDDFFQNFSYSLRLKLALECFYGNNITNNL